MNPVIHYAPVSKLNAYALIVAGLIVIAGCGANNTTVNNPKNPDGLGPAPIVLASSGSVVVAGDLGSAGNYVIMSKTGPC